MDGAKNSRTGKEKREPRTGWKDLNVLRRRRETPAGLLVLREDDAAAAVQDTDLKAVTRSGHSKRRSALGHPRGQSMKDDTGWRRRSRRRRRLDGTFTIDAGELAAWGKLTRDPG